MYIVVAYAAIPGLTKKGAMQTVEAGSLKEAGAAAALVAVQSRVVERILRAERARAAATGTAAHHVAATVQQATVPRLGTEKLLCPNQISRIKKLEAENVLPPKEQEPTLPQNFHLNAERSKELRSWMTAAQKPAKAKQLRENFVSSFGKNSFDVQVPKLDPSMARRLKEMRGGEASKAEAKEKTLAASQYKILDIAKPPLYL
jgi:hypothetical protein